MEKQMKKMENKTHTKHKLLALGVALLGLATFSTNAKSQGFILTEDRPERIRYRGRQSRVEYRDRNIRRLAQLLAVRQLYRGLPDRNAT